MILLKNARIIDGTGKTPVPCADILIKDNIIETISETGLNCEAEVTYNLAGKTVIPGLIDAHTHIGGTSTFVRPSMSRRELSCDFSEMKEGFLKWGVLTARNCGHYTEEAIAFRDDVNAGKVDRCPQIVTCGRMFQAPGGHPCYTVFMSNADVERDAVRVVDGSTDVDAAVREDALLGADFIKIFYAHLNKMNYPNEVPRITKTQLFTIIDASHKNGLNAAVHVDSASEMRDAIDCGADIIEHVMGVGQTDTDFPDDLAQLAADKGVWIVPTMVSILRFDPLEGANSVYPDLRIAVKKLYDNGVRLAVGCDSGIPFVPFGESLHDEMACLAECGIPPLEILSMATLGNAQMLGIDKVCGSVETGKRANLVVLGSDPLEDIKNTKDIKYVIN